MMPASNMIRLSLFASVLACVGCRPQSDTTSRDSQPRTEARPEPGHEPLVTESIGSDEVQTLPEERRAIVAEDRVCNWSSVWQKPNIPNPMLAGVGIPMPTKVADQEILVREKPTDGPAEFVTEIVIGPSGEVLETTFLRTPDPRWPEAEDAIRNAILGWKYEPPTFDGTPISVCTTIVLTL